MSLRPVDQRRVRSRHTKYSPAGGRSVDVLEDHRGRPFERTGILKQGRENLEGAGVVVAVAYPLVVHDLEADVLPVPRHALLVDLLVGLLGAEGQEDGRRAEVVEMVEYGLDAEGA